MEYSEFGHKCVMEYRKEIVSVDRRYLPLDLYINIKGIQDHKCGARDKDIAEDSNLLVPDVRGTLALIP